MNNGENGIVFKVNSLIFSITHSIFVQKTPSKLVMCLIARNCPETFRKVDDTM